MPATKIILLCKFIFAHIGRPFLYLFVLILKSIFHTLHWLTHSSLPFLLLKLSLIFIIILSSLSLASLTFIYFSLLKDLPPPQALSSLNPPQTSQILDRNGQLLYRLYQDQNRTSIHINELPSYVINAHLSIEDAKFYSHPGISASDITRALLNNLDRRLCKIINTPCPSTLQGASTITQQLIKNVFLSPEQSYKRKLQEAYLALKAETYYSKQQILELYLNQISYGGTAYGIEAASQTYFGISSRNLNLAQAALLAGLPAAPTAYSPFGSDPQKSFTRQKQVLLRMLEENYITQSQYQSALNQPITFIPPKTDILAPHFVMYAREQLEKNLTNQILYQGGINITTSLDYNLQQKAQQAIDTELAKLKKLNVTNAALLITKPKTGEILAMVGSADYFDTANQGNVNATLRPRQPGSSIKPLTYATALELSLTQTNPQFTPATIIDDAPVVFKIPGSHDYRPQNYDGRFHGRVTLRTALASSYNIPAVKILNSIGLNNLIQKAQELGITTWDDSSRFGLSLTLGAGEVTMADMAVAYGTFANLGYRHNLTPILDITSTNDELTYPHPSRFPFTQEPKLDPRVSYLINSILSDPIARAPTFGTHSKLNIPNHIVAVKTGTSNDLRDNWTIGYTPDFLVAVWVGNFNNSPMSRIASGITGATPIWNQMMTYMLNEYQPNNLANGWEQPAGLIKTASCHLNSDQVCTCTKPDFFIESTNPKIHTCTPNTATFSTQPNQT